VQLDKGEKFATTDSLATIATTVTIDMTARPKRDASPIGPTDTIDRNHFSRYNRFKPDFLDLV
jgi:hypothetical protein